MNFFTFLKDKIIQISLILFALITIEILLLAYPLGKFIKIYISAIILILYFASIIIEYIIKNNFYKKLLGTLDKLDEKYLATEIIKEPNFYEGKLLKESLEEIDKSMVDNVNKYKFLQEDYKEYIEMWIHEVKIPLSASKLIIENNKSKATKSIDEELDKIENYIEQALYYARSNTANKDYIIRKYNLKDIVTECIRKNKTALIQDKIIINEHDIDIDVYTDSKWAIFILNQIIQNSIKYRKNDVVAKIEIYASLEKENIILHIKDNGMGIEEGEIQRVFEKGFTGTNGRKLNKKSTGIGLYLCKKLCDKLRIGIKIESKKDIGTKIKLIFPNSSYIDMK